LLLVFKREDEMRARILFTLAIMGILALYGARSWGEGETTAPQSPQPQEGAAPKEPAPPPSITIIGASEAHGVLGRDVRGPAGEDMGRIVDVIVDREGMVRAAVIDFGGFLGVGSRKIVVDWNALHFGGVTSKSDSIMLDLTKEQVMAAPEYKEGTPIVVLGAAGSLKPWQYDHQ
jgi:PRC-barrel domain